MLCALFTLTLTLLRVVAGTPVSSNGAILVVLRALRLLRGRLLFTLWLVWSLLWLVRVGDEGGAVSAPSLLMVAVVLCCMLLCSCRVFFFFLFSFLLHAVCWGRANFASSSCLGGDCEANIAL